MELNDQIQNVRKDGKAIQIRDNWYNFFKPRLDIKKGMKVKLSYVENKGFNNIKTIEILENEPIKELKILDIKEIDDKIASMILSYSKDLCIAYIENVKSFEDLDLVMNKATECLLYSFKKIKSSL